MTTEELIVIKNKYPNITDEELLSIPVEYFNSMRITLLEKLIKECKDMLKDLHKDINLYNDEEIKFIRELLRDQKNSLECYHKDAVQDQLFLRNGLNPPLCYKNKNLNI